MQFQRNLVLLLQGTSADGLPFEMFWSSIPEANGMTDAITACKVEVRHCFFGGGPLLCSDIRPSASRRIKYSFSCNQAASEDFNLDGTIDSMVLNISVPKVADQRVTRVDLIAFMFLELKVSSPLSHSSLLSTSFSLFLSLSQTDTLTLSRMFFARLTRGASLFGCFVHASPALCVFVT